jgi:hypothetical protein
MPPIPSSSSQVRPRRALRGRAAVQPLQADVLDVLPRAKGLHLTLKQIGRLERRFGRKLDIADLAQKFPSARIEGRGATLAEIARTKVMCATGCISLATATIDKNGDIDASDLLRRELERNNQNLVMKKGDEYPVPLSFTIAQSDLVVRQERHRKPLERSGFPSRDGATRLDLRQMKHVRRALKAFDFDPDDSEMIKKVLAAQGVTVPLSKDDQLRRILLAKVDSPRNELDIDDALVRNVGARNDDIHPTVYASAKLNPARLDEVILAYKRYNNQSFAAQGFWVTKLLRKDKLPQHQFDTEGCFLKLNGRTGELESALMARHYYGQLYERKDLDALQEHTGRADLTTAISFKAHGSRLAEQQARNTWAGFGTKGVKRFDPRSHLMKDQFMGLADARPGGNAIFIPKGNLNLVNEHDDQQSINLSIQFGKTKKGLFGTRLFDLYNDGQPVERFGGTRWYYEQEARQMLS